MKKRQQTKSPLKAKPLRNPGQSLDEQIDKLVDDKITPWILVIVIPVMLATWEWYRWYKQLPYSPVALTLLAILAAGIGIWRLRKFRKELQILKLGRDGERAVGQFLENLRQDGYRVFHDVQGDGFNIDHVAIGPTGIYSIETKTFSKLVDRNVQIVFDGTKITKGGLEIDRDPVIQAKAQAKWLAELLEESTGRKNRVRPVILFPGWFVKSGWQSDLWVLNPKSLHSFMKKQESYLTRDEVALFSFHLSRSIRTHG